MAHGGGHPAARRLRVRKLLTILHTPVWQWLSLGTSFRSQIREVHDEYFFLPKALAVPDTCTASSLVGSEKPPDAACTHQRRVCPAERVPRVRVCEGRLNGGLCSD